MEEVGEVEGLWAGLLVDFVQGGGQQREGAGDCVVLAEAGLGADDVAVDAFVVAVELSGAFQQLRGGFGVVVAVVSDEGAERVEDVAADELAEGLDPDGGEVLGEVAAVELGSLAQRGQCVVSDG